MKKDDISPLHLSRKYHLYSHISVTFRPFQFEKTASLSWNRHTTKLGNFSLRPCTRSSCSNTQQQILSPPVSFSSLHYLCSHFTPPFQSQFQVFPIHKNQDGPHLATQSILSTTQNKQEKFSDGSPRKAENSKERKSCDQNNMPVRRNEYGRGRIRQRFQGCVGYSGERAECGLKSRAARGTSQRTKKI